jgi:ubiquinone/menaquinone biosynthesis C-methylase UbiE
VISDRARHTAAKYRGDTARGYEDRRAGQPKWAAEQAAVDGMLMSFPAGTTVLDIPVGTGRFLPLYALRGFKVTGIDISDDMIAQARAKGPVDGVEIRRGDIFSIDIPDASVDLVLAIRIMNLIDASDMVRALGELQRVARGSIIFNIRIWAPGTRWRHPQKMQDVQLALKPGWRIVEDVELHEPDFRMIRLAVA